MFGMDEMMKQAKEAQEENSSKRLLAFTQAFNNLNNGVSLPTVIHELLNVGLYQYLSDYDLELFMYLDANCE